MLRVVFDTNIYISAFNFGGSPYKLTILASQKVFQLFISEEIISEIISVSTKKFRHTKQTLEEIKLLISQITTLTRPAKTVSIIKNWPPDNRIFECCQKINANYLVSGDKKHLLPLKKFHSTQIIAAQEFLNILKKK